MRLSPADLEHLIAAIGLLLVAAHAVGHVFRRLRQPPVIGEILGGLLLGPTVLGALAPDAHAWLLGGDRPVSRAVLGAVHEFGLHLLMFVSGLELRSVAAPGDRRTVAAVTVAGLLLPFGLAALAFFTVVDPGPLLGPARSRGALFLVFGIAVAVTSIPVISRILLDLGLMETRFARLVLATAIAEDVVLYVLLSIALSMAGAAGGAGAGHGLPALLSLQGTGPAALAYHVAAPVALFAAALALGPAAFRAIERHPWNLVARSSPVAFLLGSLLLFTAAALFLGVAPIFGAFLAGIVAGRAAEPGSAAAERRRVVIKGFAFAFFVPIYFALVGASLDLVRRFDPLFFGGFLVLACAAKLAGIYAGARAAREPHGEAVHLAVALNARGGPGIVLASTALAAGIIAESLYTSLVLLAIVTSLLAGAWLDRRYPREARAPRPAGTLLSSRD